jgi:hypothetical protein
MSHWYHQVTDDMANIVLAIEFFEEELIDAKQECQLHGKLETASSKLPGIVEKRFSQLQEIEAILEYLNIELKRERSRVFRKYLEHYNKVLTSRDAEKFVDGEASVIALTHLVNQFSLTRNSYLSIMKGLDSKGWMIGHITRLRSAGLENVEL